MKSKVCRHCKQSLPVSSFTSTRAKYCNPCRRIVELEKQRERQNKAFERLKTKKRKPVTRVRISDRKKKVQILVNKYARLRDTKDGCISCDTGKSEHGGHFWAMGSNSALRYNLDNVHGQCVVCNFRKHGNPLEYRIRLVKKIGEDRVRWLDEHRHDVHKWTREELDEIETRVKGLIKELEE